jgi:serine/threonine protein kinase
MSYQTGKKIDKYIIEEELGEGGIAVVYKVTHEKLQVPYALKILKVSHPKLQDRLVREGQLQAQMRHPNVVSVIDVLDVDGCPGLILEYIDGYAMDDWLNKYHPSFAESEEIFLQILDALSDAHAKSIIHRDLKPSNIMMQLGRNDKLTPKVCDFGLAKALKDNQSNMTRTGMTMGTPAYMAPEQVRDAKGVNQLADIFSLGTILYELLTGKQAFQGKDTLELLNSVANLPHLPPERHVEGIPERYINAINGSLVKDPALRIPNCDVFREVLLGEKEWKVEQIFENETIAGLNLYENEHIVAKQIQTQDTILNQSNPPPVDREQKSDSLRTLEKDTKFLNDTQIKHSIPDQPHNTQGQSIHPHHGLNNKFMYFVLVFLVFAVGFLLLQATKNEPSNQTSSAEEQVTVYISSVQEKVQLYQSDILIGHTPLEFTMKEGENFEIEARKDGFISEKYSVTSRVKDIQIILKPSEEPTEENNTNSDIPKQQTKQRDSQEESKIGTKTQNKKQQEVTSDKPSSKDVSSQSDSQNKKRNNVTSTPVSANMGSILFTYKNSDDVLDAYLIANGRKYRKGELPSGKYRVYLSCRKKGSIKVRNYTVKAGKHKVFRCECDIGSCE